MGLDKRNIVGVAALALIVGLVFGLPFGMFLGSAVGILVTVLSAGGIFYGLATQRKNEIKKIKEGLSKNTRVIMDSSAYFKVGSMKQVNGWLFLTKENLIFAPLIESNRHTGALEDGYSKRRFSGDLAYNGHGSSFGRQRIPIERIQLMEQYKKRRLRITVSGEVLEFGITHIPKWIEAITAQQNVLERFGR